MVKKKLLENIEDVREELLSETNIGTEDKDIVGNLVTDVAAHLTENEQDQTTSDRLKDRIDQQITNLEMKHPRLATMLGRMASLLSSLGI